MFFCNIPAAGTNTYGRNVYLWQRVPLAHQIAGGLIKRNKHFPSLVHVIHPQEIHGQPCSDVLHNRMAPSHLMRTGSVPLDFIECGSSTWQIHFFIPGEAQCAELQWVRWKIAKPPIFSRCVQSLYTTFNGFGGQITENFKPGTAVRKAVPACEKLSVHTRQFLPEPLQVIRVEHLRGCFPGR